MYIIIKMNTVKIPINRMDIPVLSQYCTSVVFYDVCRGFLSTLLLPLCVFFQNTPLLEEDFKV